MPSHWNTSVFNRGQTLARHLQGSFFPQSKTYAAHRVWTGSTTKEIKNQPLPKKQAVRLWHAARRFERQTRQPGKQDGQLGRNGLAVLHALLFDFMNYRSGRLDPARQSIAHKAGISLRSVDRGLARLKRAGVVLWVQRCYERWIEGRYELVQDTNAYGIRPTGHWHGYIPPLEPQAPDSGTWGDHPPLLDAVTLAAAATTVAERVAALETDETNPLAAVLARLGRSLSRPH